MFIEPLSFKVTALICLVRWLVPFYRILALKRQVALALAALGGAADLTLYATVTYEIDSHSVFIF